MRVQDFLRSGGTLSDLQQRYAIKSTRSLRYPQLVLLKYSQIDSPMSEKIVRECRGLVLDESDGWAVVSRSFEKFFNHGEGHAAAVDWTTAQVQEKLDGSLCVLYSYRDEWLVQTSGHPDAAGKVGDQDFTFADLFWRLFREHGYSFPSPACLRGARFFDPEDAEHLCLSFELTSKWNRVVVQHAEAKLTLIGVRDRRSGERPVAALSHLYRPVRSFPLQSHADVAASFRHMEPLQQEGYVIVDADFNRVKVKHPGYVAIHHLRDGHSTRRLVEIVQAGEVGEFLTYFPEWRDEFEQIQNGLARLEAELVASYEAIEHVTSQKDFALEAVRTRCSAALFMLRAGKVRSVREYLTTRLRPDDALRLLELRNHVETAE